MKVLKHYWLSYKRWSYCRCFSTSSWLMPFPTILVWEYYFVFFVHFVDYCIPKDSVIKYWQLLLFLSYHQFSPLFIYRTYWSHPNLYYFTFESFFILCMLYFLNFIFSQVICLIYQFLFHSNSFFLFLIVKHVYLL